MHQVQHPAGAADFEDHPGTWLPDQHGQTSGPNKECQTSQRALPAVKWVSTIRCIIRVPPKIRFNYEFFRGYALIRVGTMAINTTCLEGVRLLGIGTFFGSCFQDKSLPF